MSRVAVLVLTLLPVLAHAQESTPAEAEAPKAAKPETPETPAEKKKGFKGPPQDWKIRLSLYGRAKPEADLDRAEASVGVYRMGGGVSAGRFFGFIRLGFGLTAERSDYDFSRTDDLAPNPPTPEDPWDVLSFVRLNLNVLIPFGRSKWSLFMFGGVRIGWENGTEIDQGISGTFFAAVGYDIERRVLQLQLGLIMITRIEDDPIAFPVFGLRWTPTDWFRVETRGPGIEIGFKPIEQLELTLGARYDNRQYRLEDRRVILADHIVEDQEALVELGATVTVGVLSIRGVVGLVAYQEFEIRDPDGEKLFASRTDPAPYFELNVSLNF